VTGVLPSGYVTFVLTDIEGSTPMLRRLGAAYSAVAERHNELLGAAFTAHGGHVVNPMGDSLLVAFSDATDALAGCCAGQASLAEERWPIAEGVRVRMGLHVGLAKPRHGDYIALAVNQTARVMSAAHGGQIVMTEAIVERLDAGRAAAVAEVGRYRLRVVLWPGKPPGSGRCC
jgi:class 3 adenylate cyclase